jgi:non-specific serine/threonine protein kinase
LARDAVLVGDDAWRHWLHAPETTAFRFEGAGAAFTARRELRRGHAYWYAYRRRGPKLEKVYLGLPEKIDLDCLCSAARRLAGAITSGQGPDKSRPPPVRGIEASYISRLPAPATRLIGRERDIAMVRDCLQADGARLVTLTGPGGTGKTRLAIEVATQVTEAFPDGVVFVDLAPLSHPDQVVPAVARALGLRDLGERPVREGIYEWLRSRRALLLLDNFEHLLPAAAELADILTHFPQVRALVTSREALRLRWERLISVPPLDLPAGGGEYSIEQIARSPAVRLFTERARDRNPAFQLTTENAPDVADVCARLDGLPLAIELAAARARLLTPHELARWLSRRLFLLDEGARDAPSRQRTLRDAIGWSHDLLSIEEQVLFRRLAVFVGGFTVAAAEVVTGRPGQLDAVPSGQTSSPDLSIFDLLQALMDKSLLKSDADAREMRFRLLETVREFGLERLEVSGEASALRARHSAYCLALVRQINNDPNEVARSDRLEREHDNVRAALRWALEGGDLRVALRLAAALRRFWWRRGYLGEGRRWLTELLARAEPDSAVRNTPEWATALGTAGYLAWAQGDYAAAIACHREAIECWVGLGEPRGLAAAQGFLGTTLCWQGELTAARPLLEQSLAGWRKLGHAVGTGNALFELGLIALVERRFANTADLWSQALSLHQEAHSLSDASYDLTMLGFVAVEQGDLVTARRRLAEARDLMVQLDDHWGSLFLLEITATLAAAEGDAARALRLVGVVSALRDRTGVPLPPAQRACFEPWFEVARKALPVGEADAATRNGRGLVAGQAISPEQLRNLLADDAKPGSGDKQRPGVLSRREREIAVLVARGLTNRAIAEQLVIAERTADTHVSNILGKLGLETRAQIAAWAVEHRLTRT